MQQHILYISYDGMTDPLGQSQVLAYLKGLSQRGFRFSLVSFEKPERFAAEREAVEEICKEYAIDWYPQTYTKRPPVLSTLKDVRRLFAVAEKIHRNKPVDIVHCRSYISALAGLRMKKKFGIPWIFDMRGFWADERVEGNIWNSENPLYRMIYRYFKRKEKQYLENSDAVISLTHAGKEELLKWELAMRPEKITVIPCCADLELFDPSRIIPEQQTALRKQLNPENKFVLGYVGSIGTWYNLTAMLQTFAAISAGKDSLFLLLTREPREMIFKEAAAQNIDPERIIVKAVPHKEIPLHLSLFDASVFYINPSFSKKASSPVKQGELMAMGIPVICNSGVGDTTELIGKYHSGIVNDLEKVPSYTAKDYDLSAFDKKKTIAGAHEYFSLNAGINRYEKVYLQLADR